MSRNKLTVSAVAVKDLAQELQRRGVLAPAQVSASSAAEAVAAGAEMHEQRQAESALRALWTEARNNSTDDALGLKIGLQVNPAARGLLARWIAHCATLGEALTTFIDHIQLLNPAERWQLLPAGDEVEIRFEFLLPYPQIAVERSMAAMLAWGAVLGGEVFRGEATAGTENASRLLPVRKAELARTEPANSQLFYQTFGPGIRFTGAPGGVNRLWLDAALLQHPLPAADVYLRDLLAARAQQLPVAGILSAGAQSNSAGQTAAKAPLSLRVLALLEQDIHKFSQIQAVCAAVHLSRSTLFRRLKAEHTSFTELLNQQRLRLARSPQAQGLNASELADLLGFCDSSSCYKFMRRCLL